MAALDGIFQARSIAVIGASRTRTKVGYQILHNLLTYGFEGPIYPVNSSAHEVHSIKAYPDVASIPDPVDLAIIVVPAKHVLDIMDQCGRKGVKGAIIITAGFSETGGEGVERERRLQEAAVRHGIRYIGPNCMGAITTDPARRMDATFAPTLPIPGRIAFMSQSGALCAAILSHARHEGIGFSKFVSMGNKSNVSGNDLLEEWGTDPSTDVILMYIENFGNPRKFTRIAKEITSVRHKPIICVKSGRTVAGAKAASSQTG